MKWLVTAVVLAMGLSVGSGCRRPRGPISQGPVGLKDEASPPVPEPGASRPPVTPDPASGGGNEAANGAGSNAGLVPPARPGDAVGGSGLGFGNDTGEASGSSAR